MKVNRALQRFAFLARQNRPEIPPGLRTRYRIERVNGGYFCDLWFLTHGCSHDICGGCVMCNYGGGCSASRANREEEQVAAELLRIIRSFPRTFEDFILTPSGSMLDSREVSPEMRERLLRVLDSVRAKRFIVETRAETVTDDSLRFLEAAVPGAEKYVEIGLESSADWVLEHCLNKGSDFGTFRAAVDMAHAHGVRVTANVGLGIPFMSERASIEQAVRTVRDALRVGADSVVLFPYHVKKHTLLYVMRQAGIYQCVSLWALAEALEQLSDVQERLQISWYKDYFGGEKSHITASPETCPRCSGDVTELLDGYRNHPGGTSAEKLRHYVCPCRDVWRTALNEQPSEIELERVEREYRQLARLLPVNQTLLEQELSRMSREYKEWTK